MKKLLLLKHWQVFGLLMGVPMFLQCITMGQIKANDNPSIMISVFPLVLILSVGLFSGWYYAVGTNLYKNLPETATINLKLFKLFLFIPVVYVLLFSLFIQGMLGNGEISKIGHPTPTFFAIFIPVNLFLIFCFFYCIFFIGKALKMVECQRNMTFNDCVVEILLIWIFPIGVWVIQPRINKLFETPTDSKNIQ